MEKRYELDTLPRKHRTIQIISTHFIDAERFPAFNHTEQTIEAIEPIDRVPYVHDATTAGVQTFGGCMAGAHYGVGDNFQGTDLELITPLGAGERATLEYTAWFEYAELPPPELRRGVGLHALEHLDLRVQFDESAQPAQLWWVKWDDPEPGSQPIAGTLESVELSLLSAEHELNNILQAQRIVENVPPGTILGFVWEYPE